MKCALFEISDSDEPEGEERFSINWSLSPTSPSNVILVEPLTTNITVPCKRERVCVCVSYLLFLSLSIAQLILTILNSSMLTVSEGDNVSICVMSNGISGISDVTLNYSIITNNTKGEWVWSVGVVFGCVYTNFCTCNLNIILVGVANNNTNDNCFL